MKLKVYNNSDPIDKIYFILPSISYNIDTSYCYGEYGAGNGIIARCGLSVNFLTYEVELSWNKYNKRIKYKLI